MLTLPAVLVPEIDDTANQWRGFSARLQTPFFRLAMDTKQRD
jgi:hypothetical protein